MESQSQNAWKVMYIEYFLGYIFLKNDFVPVQNYSHGKCNAKRFTKMPAACAVILTQ
jgi:hypothetical protein